jgi:hypothetical protein
MRIRIQGEWFLWGVFVISLIWVAYYMFTGQKPTQQLMMIQLLGLGCGLIVIIRRRRKKE